MSIEGVVHTISIILTERQNNAHTGTIRFDIVMNEGGIRSFKKNEDVELKDKRNFYKAKATLKNKK